MFAHLQALGPPTIGVFAWGEVGTSTLDVSTPQQWTNWTPSVALSFFFQSGIWGGGKGALPRSCMCAQEGVLQRTRMHLTTVSPSSQMAVERMSTHPTKFSKKNLAASERREEESAREGERGRGRV